MTTLHQQAALFGDDPAPAGPTVPAPRAPAINDMDLVADVVRRAIDPGYLLVGPAGRVFAPDPRGKSPRVDDVEPVARHEAATVHQLLDAGLFTVGAPHRVSYAGNDGPARSVLVPKPTRQMLARWQALRPLPSAPPEPAPEPEPAPDPTPDPGAGPVRVGVDIVAPGKALVTCGAGDWSGVIIRDRHHQYGQTYYVETEHGHVIGGARSYRHGAERLARHHGHHHVTVEIEDERKYLR